jgi:hypothetical protein
MEKKLTVILDRKKRKNLDDLISQEAEAGTQVLDEIKRYLQYLGK